MKYFLHCCMLCLFFFYPALSLSGICSWDACNAAKRVWDSHLKGQMSRFCILKICLLLIFVVASFVLLLFQTQGLKVNPKSLIWTFSTRIFYLRIKELASLAMLEKETLINNFQTLCFKEESRTTFQVLTSFNFQASENPWLMQQQNKKACSSFINEAVLNVVCCWRTAAAAATGSQKLLL